MNPLTIQPERLRRLRDICLALPEASEKEAWGDPTWRIRDRIFAMQKGNYEGGRPSLWLEAADGAQALLLQSDPSRFFVPPYVGHNGWIGLYLDTRSVDWSLVETMVDESYRLIAPKKLVAAREGRKPLAEPAVREARSRKVKAAPRKTTTQSPRTTRPRHRMPAFVKRELLARGLWEQYRARPSYQQNDYVGWITSAKRENTKTKRLAQMLAELERGSVYMKMAWKPAAPSARADGVRPR